MKYAAVRMICRFLMVSMMLLSFTSARAGMISTDQMASAAGAQSDRAAVLNLMSRSEVKTQLQAMGVDPQVARDRVAALTDDEVRSLAGQLNSLPAGADGGWWIAAVVVVGVIIWWMYYKK